MSDKMNKLVKEVPINFGPLHNATTNYRLTGPCGDTMEFWMMIKDERIFVATYTTDGCEHSVFCGSSAAALATGMPLEKFSRLTPEDILKNSTIDIPEESNHCGLLALNTMKGAVDKYLKTLEKKTAAPILALHAAAVQAVTAVLGSSHPQKPMAMFLLLKEKILML